MSARKSTTTPSDDESRLLARAARYRLLGRLLADPLQAPFARQADVDAGEAACAYLGDAEGVGLIGALRCLLPADDAEARAAYTAMFGLLVSPEAPPYEMEYEQRTDVFWRAGAMADIAGFHRAFGMTTVGRERPDHAGVEADFLWYLLEREAAARMLDHGAGKIALVASALRAYFADHFGSWAPSFAAALGRCAEQRGSAYYAATARLLAHVAAQESRLLGLDPAPVRPPVVTDAPPPEACDGCAVTTGSS